MIKFAHFHKKENKKVEVLIVLAAKCIQSGSKQS